MGDLLADQARVVERHRAWFEAIETTEMTRSYKMVVLLGMLNADGFPGSVRIEDLIEACRRVASRSAHLKAELLGDDASLVRGVLEKNPLHFWAGGRGTGGVSYFRYEDGVFGTTFEVDAADRPILQELTRELAEWRLAEYLSRIETRSGGSALVCAVKHSGGRPILFLPDREEHPELPSGTTTVLANGEAYEADFVKVAVNVLRRPGQEGNELPAVLRGWFGADAGLPGTAHAVALERGADGSWTLRPLGGRRADLQLWRRYSREEIPPLFGLALSEAVWNAGFVVRPGHIFLLVTLDKAGKAESFQYRDRFLSPTVFQWESQEPDAAGGRARAGDPGARGARDCRASVRAAREQGGWAVGAVCLLRGRAVSGLGGRAADHGAVGTGGGGAGEVVGGTAGTSFLGTLPTLSSMYRGRSPGERTSTVRSGATDP